MRHLWLIVLLVVLEVIKVNSSLWDNSPSCGRRFLTKRTDEYPKRIVGGSESKQGSWPWQIALLRNGSQWCGGSIIDKNWIVTAAHCVVSGPANNISALPPEIFSVALGEHSLGVKQSFEQIKKVEKIIIHPDYDFLVEGRRLRCIDNDIALLKLSTPATFDKFIRPVCLLSNKRTFPWGKECYVTGWGTTKFNGDQPDALREVKVKLVSHKVCNQIRSYKGCIHDVALCAGFQKGGVDACSGDSGGPLSCESQGKFFLTGVVSWGIGCALPHKYGVYANMMALTSWVTESTIKNIEQKSQKKTY